jgi:hypothetical protein
MATTRSAGLRKFIPQPDRYVERYGNFTLTRPDLEILDVVHRYRYLEARHIRALFGGSDQQITRRLQGLFHNGYLGRYARRERMRLELDPGAPLIAYGLETKGARALQGRSQPTTDPSTEEADLVSWKKAHTRRTEWFLEHHLMVSNFRCVFELALRTTPGTELVTWDQGQDTWFRVTIPGERRRIARIAPDASFTVRRAGETRHFYLELDRSTEEQRRLLKKFIGYWWYCQSPVRDSTHGGRARVNVLFVTTGQRRMLNLMETLRQMPKPNRAEHGGKGLFWFCVAGEYSLGEPTSLLGPIWRCTSGVNHRLGFQDPILKHGS